MLQATNPLAEAEPLYRRALSIEEKSFGPEHPNVATNLNNLAVLLEESFGRYDESEKFKRRALAIVRTRLGRPGVSEDVVQRVRDELVKRSWDVKVARIVGVGSGTVQKIKREMACG